VSIPISLPLLNPDTGTYPKFPFQKFEVSAVVSFDDFGQVMVPTEVIPHLYLSSFQVASDRELLLQYKIKEILNVCSEHPCCFPDDFRYMHIKIHDTPLDNALGCFDQATEFIHTAVSQRRSVLVHCSAGVSRSATFVIAYLMKIGNISLKDALMALRAKRGTIMPNYGFLAQLHKEEERLFGQNSITLEQLYVMYLQYVMPNKNDKEIIDALRNANNDVRLAFSELMKISDATVSVTTN